MTQSDFDLVYVVDWLPPEFGAVGQYALLFAREEAARGQKICLIGLSRAQSHTVTEPFASGGFVEIRRLAIGPLDRANWRGRLLWAMGANWRLMREAARAARGAATELLFTGSPPFMLWFAVPAKWLTGARLVYRITDFYPEVIAAARSRPSRLLAVLTGLTWWLRRRVDRFEVLGEDQRTLLLRGGIAADRIVLRRYPSPVVVTGTETPAEKPAVLSGHRVLLYSGNYGVAHEVETVLEGYRRHHRSGSGSFVLWLNATGANADWLEARLTAEALPYARTPPCTLEALPHVLACADVHLICLRPAFSGYVLPSKVYACIDSRKPVLFVGPETSDVHLLCAQQACGYARIEIGDGHGFAAALEQWAQDNAGSTGQFRSSVKG
jgi:hypothetical protein